MGHDSINSIIQDGAPTEVQKTTAAGLSSKARLTAKKILHLQSPAQSQGFDATIHQLDDDPAFNPRRFLNQPRTHPKSLPEKVNRLVRGAAQAVVHPIEAIKQRATQHTAGKLAKSRPFLTKKADLDFLKAHDDLAHAKDQHERGDEQGKKDAEIDRRVEDIADIELRRQELRVAWFTARHVHRVRAVEAIPLPEVPSVDSARGSDSAPSRINWGRWIAYKLLRGSYCFTAPYMDDLNELPFDLDTLKRHVERLIIVSAPVQEYLLDLRRIYRWEDPARTGRCMVAYFFLWYISHIMTYFFAYIIYIVLMNFYHPRPAEELRKAIERTLDRGATVLKIGELMDQHGSSDWLSPLLDELGPYIQLQVADLASFIEVCDNFYHYRSPSATVNSLILFGSLFLINAFGDARFIMKVFWLILGLAFFACWPVSSLNPRYRLLVSPMRWIFWDVPDYATWSFAFLQERAAQVKQQISTSELSETADVASPQNIDDEHSEAESFESAVSQLLRKTDIFKFTCTYHHTPGVLVVSTDGLRFSTPALNAASTKAFSKPYADLIEMSKGHGRSSIRQSAGKSIVGPNSLELRIKGKDDEIVVILLEHFKNRDKAFNSIIAFSGIKWQHLQKRPCMK